MQVVVAQQKQDSSDRAILSAAVDHIGMQRLCLRRLTRSFPFPLVPRDFHGFGMAEKERERERERDREREIERERMRSVEREIDAGRERDRSRER